MKTSTKILIGAGTLGAIAYAYYQGAKNMRFFVAGVGLEADGRVWLRIGAQNPSSVFGYPVPALDVGVFDSNDTYLGTIVNHQLQYIAAGGTSFIDGYVYPNMSTIFSTLTGYAVTGRLPADFTLQGNIRIANYLVPFTAKASAIGRVGNIIEKLPEAYYECLDGTYSDHNRNRACTWHGGMVSDEPVYVPEKISTIERNRKKYLELKQNCAPGAQPTSENLLVRDVPLKNIQLYLKKFQNRETPYSIESVQRIVDAVNNNTFRFEEFDPVLLWAAPDGNLYMLSGHSRLEAFTRLCAEGKKQFCTIPAKVLSVSQIEAEEIALRSNTLSTKEKETERAMFYRKELSMGKSYAQIIEAAKKNEGSNAQRIVSYSFLNPFGKTFIALKALENSDATSKGAMGIIAQWIGEARMKFNFLTDAHEDELYTWLTNGGYGKMYTAKNDFLRKLASVINQRTYMGVFDNSQPLNVYNTVTKNFSERQFDEMEADLKEKIVDKDAEIKQKAANYKQRGATADQIYKMLENDYAVLSRLRNELTVLYQKKSNIVNQPQTASLFGIRGSYPGNCYC